MARLIPGDKNLTDGIQQFLSAMDNLGIPLPNEGVIGDSKLHRFSTSPNGTRKRNDGSKVKDDSGWYIYIPGSVPIALFGDFRSQGSDVFIWCMNVGRELSPQEKADQQKFIREAQEKFAEEKRQGQAVAQEKANNMLKYSKPASPDFPYLMQKKIDKPNTARSWNDVLLVPVIDTSGKVHSVQIINKDGGKYFLKGGKVEGCFAQIGNVAKARTILIAEGYATGETISKATGMPVIVAFNSGNLGMVAEAIRVKRPTIDLIFCADDDWKVMLMRKGKMVHVNPGVVAAQEAAEKHNGHIILPIFDLNRPDWATDFNDMAVLYGENEVSNYFSDELSKLRNNKQKTIENNIDAELIEYDDESLQLS